MANLIEFNGKIACVTEHCKDLGISPNTLWTRKHRTGESDLECLKYYQENGVKSVIRARPKHRHSYKIKDKRLYSKWYSTKEKCENPKHTAYPRYGAKGIKVCERWQNYENFENDLLESFLKHIEEYGIKNTTLDRYPDKEGNYEPNNVRWATMKEQQNNKTNNRMITKELNVTQFAEKYNIPYSVVLARLNAGWSIERIINTPIKKSKYYLPCGVSLRHHCLKNNYVYTAIINYIKQYNLTPDKALAKYLKEIKNE